MQYVGGKSFTAPSGSFSLTDLAGGIASAPVAGDIVIVVVTAFRQTNSANYPTISDGANPYNTIAQIFSDDSNETHMTTSYKIMGGSPDTTVTIGNSPAMSRASIHVWRDVDSVTPLDVTRTTAQGINSSNVNAPAITPVTAGAIVLAIGASGFGNNNHGITGEPSGYSNFTGGGDFSTRSSTGIASKAWSGSGSEDPEAFSVGGTSTANSWGAVTVALRPATPPTVTTSAASDIEADIATANGNITATGTPPVTRRGFVYSTSSHGDPGDVAPEASDYEEVSDETGSFSTGTFDLPLTPLTQNTTYYFRAFAYNGVGYSYGGQQSFTSDILPVQTDNASGVSQTEATLNGQILSGTASIRGFVFGKSSESNPGNVAPGSSGYDDSIDESGSFSTGAFDLTPTGLDYDDTYYFRAFVRDSLGDYYYGAQLSFSTLPLEAPVIESVDPSGSGLDVETEIVITGQNFFEGATVEIDGDLCDDIVVVDSTTITCTAPSSAVAKSVALVVTNPDAQFAESTFFYIGIIPPTPQPEAVEATFMVKGVGIVR